MKTLFLIGLKFPLINAINLKLNEFKDKSVDLFFTSDSPEMLDLAVRVAKLKIFDNVVILHQESSVKNLKSFFRSQYYGCENVLTLISNYCREFFYLYIDKNKYIVSIIGKEINDGYSWNPASYDMIFFTAHDKTIEAIISSVHSAGNLKSINLLDEGVGTYVQEEWISKYFKKFKKIPFNAYVYMPELVVWKDVLSHIKIYKIKKMSFDDIVLKNIINYVFKYKEESSVVRNKIFFFEQVCEPMPDYIQQAKGLKKVLFRNSYRKHLADHLKFYDKCNTFNSIVDSIKSKKYDKNFIVKLHPRSKLGIPEGAGKYVLKSDVGSNIPWEVYVLNNKFDNNIWISSFSSALVNTLYAFDNNFDVSRILTYYAEQYYKDNTDLQVDKFLKNLERLYPNKLLLVRSQSELRKILLERIK